MTTASGQSQTIVILDFGSQYAQLIARRTRNYAKRQLTWFNADKRICWLPGEEGMDAHLRAVRQGLEDR